MVSMQPPDAQLLEAWRILRQTTKSIALFSVLVDDELYADVCRKYAGRSCGVWTEPQPDVGPGPATPTVNQVSCSGSLRKLGDASLSFASVREQYISRAAVDLGLRVDVIDFSQYAGRTTNACFWLCLAAGLASSSWSSDSVVGHALPANIVAKLTDARAMNLGVLV